MKSFQLAFLIGLALALANGASIDNAGPVGFYNCAGLPQGDYDHPYDCHKYIACTNASLAYEMDCPVCHVNPVDCPAGRLVFDQAKDSCEWAHLTFCHSSGGASTSEQAQQTTEFDQGTSTEESATLSPPVIGDQCDPHNCTTHGDCKTYYTCDEKTKTWVKRSCGVGMAWNPNGPGKQHGGNCQLFDTLPQSLKEKYWNSKDCLACRWQLKNETCSSKYDYLPPKRFDVIFDEIDCGADLVFDLSLLTCVHCSVAVDAKTGTRCCSKPLPTPVPFGP